MRHSFFVTFRVQFSFLSALAMLFPYGLSLFPARFVTPSRRLVTPSRLFVTYRPRDGRFTARGTAGLPPEGRQVYRPWDGKFTARGAVSNKSAGKSNGDKGKSDEA